MAVEYKATDLPGKSLYKKQFNVLLRPITPIEQKYILSLSQKEQRTNAEYIAFLKKLVTFDNPEMTFEELYWADVQYILYKLRYITYAKFPIKLEFICGECKERIIHELDIGAMEITEPDINLQKTIVLDNLGEMPIRNKIIGDEIAIEQFCKKKHLDENDFQTQLLLMDLCALSGEKTLDELYTLAEAGEITAMDIINVEQWIVNNVWGVKENVTVKCAKCGKEVSRGYLLSIEDFFSIV